MRQESAEAMNWSRAGTACFALKVERRDLSVGHRRAALPAAMGAP